MPQHYHTIILGLGAMGSATAAQLASRLPKHQRVLGLEQFDIPNSLGSSHGQSRLIRLAYYEHPDYVPLLRRSYQLWHQLEQRAATKILHITGGLYLGPPNHELIAGSRRSATQFKLDHTMLTARQVQARFPQFKLPPAHVGFFEADAGFLLPEKAVAAHAAEALKHGAQLHAFEPALRWHATPKRGRTPASVTVTTGRGTYRAQHLVITAGAWADQLLPPLARKITVTRQSLFWFWPRKPEQFSPSQFPCWCAASSHGGLVYGPPMLPDEIAPLGLKIAHHFPGKVTHPDTVDRRLRPGDADVVTKTIRKLLPDLHPQPLSHRVCLYSNSPDHHFIIDRHPQHANIFFAAGFSGHGFKFAPVIGEILADLALTATTAHPVHFLRLQRFAP